MCPIALLDDLALQTPFRCDRFEVGTLQDPSQNNNEFTAEIALPMLGVDHRHLWFDLVIYHDLRQELRPSQNPKSGR